MSRVKNIPQTSSPNDKQTKFIFEKLIDFPLVQDTYCLGLFWFGI